MKIEVNVLKESLNYYNRVKLVFLFKLMGQGSFFEEVKLKLRFDISMCKVFEARENLIYLRN